MKERRLLLWILGLLLAPVPSIHGQDKSPLKLIQEIRLPNVKGRIDHMDIDVRGKRLFVAGLENGTLEVVDPSRLPPTTRKKPQSYCSRRRHQRGSYENSSRAPRHRFPD